MQICLIGIILLSFCKLTTQATILSTQAQVTHGQVDESLYSRQLYVYGRSAQQKLQHAHVLIKGHSPLLAEIVKNVALTGIGKISIDGSDGSDGCSKYHLKGESLDLVSYAQALNPYIKAENVSSKSFTSFENYTAVICVDQSWDEMMHVNDVCRYYSLNKKDATSTTLMGRESVITASPTLGDIEKTKFIACAVRGVCGFVFDDFSEGFQVEDTDGETAKDIPVLKITLLSEASRHFFLKVESIEEESFTCGISDPIELYVSVARGENPSNETESRDVLKVIMNVSQVLSSQSIVAELDLSESSTAEDFLAILINKAKDGKVVLKNAKKTAVVNHQSLREQLINPTFVQANGCQPKRKDRALSLAVLSAFLAVDQSHSLPEVDQMPIAGEGISARRAFRHRMLLALKSLGVHSPLVHWKNVTAGGAVGTEILSLVSGRFHLSDSTSSTPSSQQKRPDLRSTKYRGKRKVEKRSGEREKEDQVSASLHIKQASRPPVLARATSSPTYTCPDQCPATVSVIGAIATQEIIKACTNVHMPLSQLLVFESFDSILPFQDLDQNDWSARGDESDDKPLYSIDDENYGKHLGVDVKNAATACSSSTHAERVYGRVLAQELSRLRIFVVGSGAIGCELLKTFALMGVATQEKGAAVSALTSSIARPHSTPVPAGSSSSSSSNNNSSAHGDLITSVSAPETENIDETKGDLSGSRRLRGIIVTDMDHIERSNLNRQLLFREKHVGCPKSVTAASMLKLINPDIIVEGITMKVCEESENFFDSQFWSETDIVTTALDNIDARLYVDRRCVLYGKWLVDSGTLGTKGNTQVVIPFLTESYASSADPPEQAIPMCTLKSFPYQPDHCVAWGRSIFDKHFFSGPRILQSALTQSTDQTDKFIDSLSAEDLKRALEDLRFLISGEKIESLDTQKQKAIAWAISLFEAYFKTDIEQLHREHPELEVDDEGNLFWGGSRRFPAVTILDISNPAHSAFIDAAVTLRLRISSAIDNTAAATFAKSSARMNEMNATDTISTDLPKNHFTDLSASINLIVSELDATRKSTSQSIDEESTHASLEDSEVATQRLADCLRRELKSLSGEQRSSFALRVCPEEFEKDVLGLGHVAFVAAASNLRCLAYRIRSVDSLEVQRIAGRIVPAVATTTALVSGLVALEVLKIAGEKLRARRVRQQHAESVAALDAREAVSADAESEANKKDHDQKNSQKTKNIFRNFFTSSSKSKSSRDTANKNKQKFQSADLPYGLSADEKERRRKERLLQRFRNGFVNIALPMLAFTQPVPAETFAVGVTRMYADKYGVGLRTGNSLQKLSVDFSLWDVIQAPSTVSELTIEGLDSFLIDYFDAKIQSVSWGDSLIFADFLPSAEDLYSQSLGSIIENCAIDNEKSLTEGSVDEDGFVDDRMRQEESLNSSSKSSAKSSEGMTKNGFFDLAKNGKFIDLDVVCTRAPKDALESSNEQNVNSEASDDEDTIRLPPVRIYFTSINDCVDSKNNSDKSQRKDLKFRNRSLKNRVDALLSGSLKEKLKHFF